ncbi:hypothetical protein M011DRAFT_465528 [Sporormia fimetaria CBS 119925]|uniref:Uncharacterized protein n=1 Tax=Sporormia fimetaria CBS 119925 TaxID=1340428 RepID=A0A6A6VGY0_9PLEO|nr:hypothetical protein M011DRAFT_465528 [Sporormia fimetaria CBS 119925]
MTLLFHAVRRGIQHVSASSLESGLAKRDATTDAAMMAGAVGSLPPAYGLPLILGFILFVVVVCALDYTLYNVVATLAMVESPTAAVTVTAASDEGLDEAKQGLLDEDNITVTLVNEKPVTSSIRGTIRHLRGQAGRFAPWRGYKAYMLYNLAFNVIGNIMLVALPQNAFVMVVVTALSGALVSHLHANWAHKVVSMPNTKSWRQRLLPRENWKNIALPAAVAACADYVAIIVAGATVYLIGLFDVLPKVGDSRSKELAFSAIIPRAVCVVAVFAACMLFISLPAHVTLVRVEASLLPDSDETVVPFDRTFAGKVVPRLLGGTGCVGFVDAWRSFNWEARRRLVKLYAKATAIVSLVMFVFAFVFLLMTVLIFAAENERHARESESFRNGH